MVDTSLLAVFLLGLFGGVHCAGMCGGIVAALGMASSRVAVPVPSKPVTSAGFSSASSGGAGSATTAAHVRAPISAPVTVWESASGLGQESGLRSGHNAGLIAGKRLSRSVLPLQNVLAFNLARVSTYIVLGALAGAVGSLGFLLDRLLPIQQTALALANLVLIAMGLYVYGIRTVTRALESLGAPLWKRLQPYAAKALGRSDGRGLLLAGSLWGLVPCGMVYTVLIAAMTTAQPVEGALLMGAFGLGTLPNLVAMGLSARLLSRLRSHRILRRVVGGAFVLVGVAGIFHLDAVLGLPLIGELCFRPV